MNAALKGEAVPNPRRLLTLILQDKSVIDTFPLFLYSIFEVCRFVLAHHYTEGDCCVGNLINLNSFYIIATSVPPSFLRRKPIFMMDHNMVLNKKQFSVKAK